MTDVERGLFDACVMALKQVDYLPHPQCVEVGDALRAAITAWNARAALSAMPSGDEVREVLREVRHRLPDRYNDDAALIARVDDLLAKLAPPQETTDER